MGVATTHLDDLAELRLNCFFFINSEFITTWNIIIIQVNSKLLTIAIRLFQSNNIWKDI